MDMYIISNSDGFSLHFPNKALYEQYNVAKEQFDAAWYGTIRAKYGVFASNQHKFVSSVTEFNSYDIQADDKRWHKLGSPVVDAAPAVALPPMNQHLLDILGRPNFTCSKIAERLRILGHVIPRKSEHEQAHAIHLLLSMYLQHGEDWHKHALKALRID